MPIIDPAIILDERTGALLDTAADQLACVLEAEGLEGLMLTVERDGFEEPSFWLMLRATPKERQGPRTKDGWTLDFESRWP